MPPGRFCLPEGLTSRGGVGRQPYGVVCLSYYLPSGGSFLEGICLPVGSASGGSAFQGQTALKRPTGGQYTGMHTCIPINSWISWIPSLKQLHVHRSKEYGI